MSGLAQVISSTFSTLFRGPTVPKIDVPSVPAVPRISEAQLAERARRASGARRGFEANILGGSPLGRSLPPAQAAGRPLNGTGGVKPQPATLLGG